MKKNVNVNGNVNNGTETIYECPVCHARFALPTHQHVVTGIAIGKDSGLGVVHPVLEGEQPEAHGAHNVTYSTGSTSMAQRKIDALRASGVDVSNFFAVSGGNSDEGCIGKMSGNGITIIDDDDPIFAGIVFDIEENGEINNPYLFRRWLLGQYIDGELRTDWRTHKKIGFTKAIHLHGYEYTFRMTLEEYRVQARIIHNANKETNREVRNLALEDANIRGAWFSKAVGLALIDHDIRMLREYVESRSVRHCEGRPYKRIRNRDVFTNEIESKVFVKLIALYNNFNDATCPEEYYNVLRKYVDARISLSNDTPQCREWVDAYKGIGADYNMRNLIMFHGCLMHDEDGDCYSYQESLDLVAEARERFAGGAGWCMLGKLRQLLRDNNIDIEAMRNDWRSKK